MGIELMKIWGLVREHHDLETGSLFMNNTIMYHKGTKTPYPYNTGAAFWCLWHSILLTHQSLSAV